MSQIMVVVICLFKFVKLIEIYNYKRCLSSHLNYISIQIKYNSLYNISPPLPIFSSFQMLSHMVEHGRSEENTLSREINVSLSLGSLPPFQWSLPFQFVLYQKCVTFITWLYTLKYLCFSENLAPKTLLELTQIHIREASQFYRYVLSTKEE